MQIDSSLITIGVIGGMVSSLIIKLLNFLLKSRCETIRCCWGAVECNRNVVSETTLNNDIIKNDITQNEINVPANIVNIKK